MSPTLRWAAALSLLAFASGPQRPLQPPRAVTGTHAETFHGTAVADPYRSLEADTPERSAFMQAQEQLLDAYLSDPDARPSIAARVRQLIDYESISTPVKAGGFYFYSKGSGVNLSAARTLVMRPAAGGNERVLLAPGKGSVTGFSPSPDGSLVAYLEPKSGDSAAALRILRSADATTLPGRIELSGQLAGPVTWNADSKGFYYSTLQRPATAAGGVQTRRLFHRTLAGTEARLVSEVDAPSNEILSHGLTRGSRYLISASQVGTDPRTRLTYQALDRAVEPVALVPERTAAYSFLGGVDDTFWFYTDDQAPNGRIVAVDVGEGAPRWREVVKEMPEAISARDQTGGNALGMYGGHLVLTYIRDGRPFLRTFTLDGTPRSTVELPAGGSIWNGFSGSHDDGEVLYWFLGVTDPSTIYRLDLASGATSVVHRAPIPIDASNIVVTQEFYPSWDGTRIPMFVARRRDVVLDGRAPALMYGYGALGWVSFVWYQPHVLAWIENGGVYAQPSIRGGGEYGQAWHQAALKTKKVTAVKDFVAAAQWLVAAKITSPDRLVGNGGSLSAPLISAAARMQPGLFAALVIDRPVTDMIRFENFTGGAFWSQEFGTPSIEEEFRSLLALSPYHNALKPSCMPPTLVMAGDGDRVAPVLHGLKLTAALQANQVCDNPILLKVMRTSTHNFGGTVDDQVESYTDLLAFLGRALAGRLPPPR